MFTPRIARKSLERYRRKGLGRLERRMLESVSEEDLGGGRVLEIGGGIGALQAELLEAGAERGEIVELAAAYEPYALELARERGLEPRVAFRVVDVLEEPDAVEPGDVVLLNRVVCCSPDGVRLASAAAVLARRMVVLSFPRDRVVVRAALALVNGGMRVLGRSFRVFVHSRAALLAAIEAEGLAVAGAGRDFAWEFVALRRPS